MLRFCALYGFSGAIDDVLGGKYGSSDEVSIDTLLPFKEHDAPIEKAWGRFSLSFMFSFEDMFMPANGPLARHLGIIMWYAIVFKILVQRRM